ncbi:MAG: PqiC family protein [Lautropia sp.]
MKLSRTRLATCGSFVASTCVLLVLAACAAAPVRFYTLAGAAPLPAPRQTAPAPGSAARVQFELAPVGVPERLARPQMVVRSEADSSSTRVSVLEQQRWSSPFDRELRDSFGLALAASLGANDVSRGGQLPGQPVYRIAIQMQQFDAALDQQVQASFGWTITRSDNNDIAICQAVATQPVGPGMEELVHGIHRLVVQTADRIASQIDALKGGRVPTCDRSASS